MADIETTAKDEYSLQYFGFTPEEFFRDFSEAFVDEVTCIIQEIIAQLNEFTPSNKTEQISKEKQECSEMHRLLCERVVVTMNEIKPLIDDAFTIPKNVCLPLDANKQHTYTEPEVEKLEKDVAELEKQYKGTLDEIEFTKQKIALYEQVERVYKMVDEAMQLLKQFGNNLVGVKEIEKLDSIHNEHLTKLGHVTEKYRMKKFQHMFVSTLEES